MAYNYKRGQTDAIKQIIDFLKEQETVKENIIKKQENKEAYEI